MVVKVVISDWYRTKTYYARDLNKAFKFVTKKIQELLEEGYLIEDQRHIIEDNIELYQWAIGPFSVEVWVIS